MLQTCYKEVLVQASYRHNSKRCYKRVTDMLQVSVTSILQTSFKREARVLQALQSVTSRLKTCYREISNDTEVRSLQVVLRRPVSGEGCSAVFFKKNQRCDGRVGDSFRDGR